MLFVCDLHQILQPDLGADQQSFFVCFFPQEQIKLVLPLRKERPCPVGVGLLFEVPDQKDDKRGGLKHNRQA